jgi:hypothetical protein
LTSTCAGLRLGAMDERPGTTPIENFNADPFASFLGAKAL